MYVEFLHANSADPSKNKTSVYFKSSKSGLENVRAHFQIFRSELCQFSFIKVKVHRFHIVCFFELSKNNRMMYQKSRYTQSLAIKFAIVADNNMLINFSQNYKKKLFRNSELAQLY